jgi:hypothetical protein
MPANVLTPLPALAMPPLGHCVHHHAIPPNNCPQLWTSSSASPRLPAPQCLATFSLPRTNVAIASYFDSAGQEVTVLPCPNFANFFIKHSLQERNISLIIDLPRYIIPAGTCILQANQYSALPNQDWLLAPPDLSSLYASSQCSSHRSSLSSCSLLLHRDAHSSLHPDPDGVDASHAYPPSSRLAYHAPVQAIFMGGTYGSHGGFSPLTYQGSGSMGGSGRPMEGRDSAQGPFSVGGGNGTYLPGSPGTSHVLFRHPCSSLHPPRTARCQLSRLRPRELFIRCLRSQFFGPSCHHDQRQGSGPWSQGYP